MINPWRTTINPNINLQSLSHKDFLIKYKGINSADIRFGVVGIINERGLNKNFLVPPKKHEEREKGSEDYYKKISKTYFPRGKTSHAEYSHPERNKD